MHLGLEVRGRKTITFALEVIYPQPNLVLAVARLLAAAGAAAARVPPVPTGRVPPVPMGLVPPVPTVSSPQWSAESPDGGHVMSMPISVPTHCPPWHAT